MLKYITTVLIVLSLLSSASFAQAKKMTDKKMQVLKREKVESFGSTFYSDYVQRKLTRLPKTSAAAQEIMYATYDWMYNGWAPNTLAMYDITGDGVKDPIAIACDNSPLDNPERHTVIGYIDELGGASYALYGTNEGTGRYYRTGWNPMLILDEANGALYPVVYDFLTGALNNYIWAIDLTTDVTAATKVTSDGYSGGWSRMTKVGDTFWSIDDNTPDYGSIFKIMKSDDGGVTFDSVDYFSGTDPNFWFTGYGGTEDPLIESGGNKLSIISAVPRYGAYNPLGFFSSGTDYIDSADVMYHYYSTDAGATWQGEEFETDGAQGQVANRPNMWSAVGSWDIGDVVVDPTGVTHLAHIGVNCVDIINGGADTSATFPIFYWNDKDKQLLAVTDTVLEYYYPLPDDDSFSQPGNMLGNSAPTIAVSDDGKVVAIVFVIPEFSGEVGNSDLNVYPGDGGDNTGAVYHTDLAFTYSGDGGKTWSKPEIIESQKNYSEQWPILSPKIEVAGTEAKIDYMFFYDAIPGAASSGSPTNSLSPDSKWLYNNKTFTVTTVGVNEDAALLKNYSLEQNYPNPFNPSTDIKFTLAKAGNVSLKIYDVLGREVATLVNGAMESGSHTINFNASNLSSGMYLYTINADNFSMTKKMMLMK